MENLSCYGNQTKEIIFLKKKTKKNPTKPVKANMMNISTKSQPHRAYGFIGDNFLSIFLLFFAFWFPWQPMKLSSGQKII